MKTNLLFILFFLSHIHLTGQETNQVLTRSGNELVAEITPESTALSKIAQQAAPVRIETGLILGVLQDG
jgi:hypothetical protein